MTSQNSQEGAASTMAVFAIMFMLLAVTALAVDAGNLWVSRRTQIADTDAAALAVAQLLTDDPCSSTVQATAEQLIDDAQMAAPVVTPPPGVCPTHGVVKVETTRTVEFIFAPLASALMGLDDGLESSNTHAASMVAYGQENAAAGLLPVGFCIDALRGGDVEMVTEEYSGVAAYPVYRVSLEGLKKSSCAKGEKVGNGNWGLIDFNGKIGGLGIDDIEGWLEPDAGYPHEITLGDPGPGDEDCNPENVSDDPEDPCPGKPTEAGGKKLVDQFAYWAACGKSITTAECDRRAHVVVFDSIKAQGANTELGLSSFAQVIFRHSPENFTGKGFYFDLELLDELGHGTPGAVDPESLAPMVTQLCGVDGFDANCPTFAP